MLAHRGPRRGGGAAPGARPRPAARRAPTRGAARALLRTVVLALCACAWLGSARPAWASDPFPVQESFRGASFGAAWRPGGSAELTGGYEAEGWLRLTSAENSEFGYAYDDEAFPSVDGALVEFEYADWGGSGADGLTFFLFDGATTETEFHAGQPGGALGYASCNDTTNGLTDAYVGVGFDEYGNFTNLGSICGLDGTEFLPNHVSVRGGSAESYRLLATAPTSESLLADRGQARRVTIAVTPAGKLSVYIRYPDGSYQGVTENFQLPQAPETLKFGYVASTGGLSDFHEIRDAQVLKPTQVTPSVRQSGGGDEHGEPLTWTAVVRNEGPNPTQREQLRASTGEQSLSNVRWTCEAAGGAQCPSGEGSGLPNVQAGAMAQGSSFTYRITGTPTSSSEYAQMTIESEPLGDTGELDPEKERATATTELAPLFETEPTFTLAADGEASAAPVNAVGSEVSYSYRWQRCEPSNASELCTDIAGAQASAYHTTGADLGDTIRFTETATNPAGSATVDSAVYKPLPTAEITAAPAGSASSGEAAISFAASTGEAVLECSFDGGAWSACTSPMRYEGLAEGEHTFSVRAVYGGLSGSPAQARWTFQAPTFPTPAFAQGSNPAPDDKQPSATPEQGATAQSKATQSRLAGRRRQPRRRRTHRRGIHRLRAHRLGTHRATGRPGTQHKTRRAAKVQLHRGGAQVKRHRMVTVVHTLEHHARPRRAAPTPNGHTPTTHAVRQGKDGIHAVKRVTRMRAHKGRLEAHAPTSRPRFERESPGGGGAPAATEQHPRHTTRRAPHAKTRAPAATPTPTPTSPPKDRGKVKNGAHAPAAKRAPKRRTHTPATMPPRFHTTHRPPGGRAHRRMLRRHASANGANPVIRPFRPQSAILARRAVALVKRIAAALAHARRVVCIGYTDNLGARSANVALGLKRAQTVCARLRALGVHAALKAESRGEQHPCASNATARGRALNRRVELRISYVAGSGAKRVRSTSLSLRFSRFTSRCWWGVSFAAGLPRLRRSSGSRCRS